MAKGANLGKFDAFRELLAAGGVRSADINTKSEGFQILLHRGKARLPNFGSQALDTPRRRDTFTSLNKKTARCAPQCLWVAKKAELLEGVHQSRDRTIEILVGTTKLLNLIDGVQHGGVMFATELAADFRK